MHETQGPSSMRFKGQAANSKPFSGVGLLQDESGSRASKGCSADDRAFLSSAAKNKVKVVFCLLQVYFPFTHPLEY